MVKPEVNTFVKQSRIFAIGWRLLRPPTLTASIAPVLVGTGLALHIAHFHVWLFIAMLVSSMLIQAVANMINEYYDFKRGLDNEHMVGIAGTIVRDKVAPKTVLLIAWITLLIAVLLGLYIALSTSWWVAVAGIFSMLFMYLYSSGPHPISSTPFGEVTAGMIMGPVIVLISYFIQAENLTLRAAIASLPVAIFIGSILLANNIRDIVHDQEGGRKTLPILLGRNGAISTLRIAVIVAYAVIVLMIVFSQLSLWSLITLLAIPAALRGPRLFSQTREAKKLQQAFKMVSQTLILFAALLFISLLIAP